MTVCAPAACPTAEPSRSRTLADDKALSGAEKLRRSMLTGFPDAATRR
jgi:hypothetical protein